ncbi:MAG TPA: YsnF/AvaK domain-containing protein [Ktedonobacteraceae bacterium]|jgi:uncharacterized protein (TIGR02271 family)
MEHTQMSSPLEHEQRMQLREEILQIQKELVKIGSVFIRKIVVTEEQTITVPVRREEVVIEYHTGFPGSSEQSASRQDETLIELGEKKNLCIPLSTEQIIVETRPVVTEEVLVSKRTIQELRCFTTTVQHEEAYIEREGNVAIHSKFIEEMPPSPGKETDQMKRQ